MSDDALEDEISTRRRARLEAGIESVEARAVGEQQLGYAARDFVLCGFPLRRTRGLTFSRRNGEMLLKLKGHAEYGLPYGQDRLIPIWLATAFFAAGKPRDNVIRFRCASDILRAFGQDTSGGRACERLRERLLRVFECTYFVSHRRPTVDGGAKLDEQRYSLMRSIRVNLLEDKRQHSNQYTLWQDRIELDQGFAQDLRDGGRVPIDLETVRALKESSAALDLYVWQAWRSYRLERDGKPPTSIPIFGEGGLMAQLGSEATTPKKIKAQLRGWQAEVSKVWQGCPNFLDRDCERLFIHPGNAIATSQQIPELPGVSLNPPAMRDAGGVDGATLCLYREDPTGIS